LSEGVDENVVMLAYGYGQPYTNGGWRSSNDLTPYVDSDPISGSTSNRRVPVRVVREGDERNEERTDTLALLVNTDRCVGCHTCEVACAQEHGKKRIRVNILGPVKCADGEMKMDAVPLATEECDLCRARLERGDDPACVSACPTKALLISPLAETIRLLRTGGHQLCALRTVGDFPKEKK
jgi:ferredoxin